MRNIRIARVKSLGEALKQILTRLRFFSLRAQGFTGSMARHWVRLTDEDKKFRGAGLSRSHIRRAHRWGFSALIVLRFGITDKNRHNFLSEREYAHSAPLNGKYGKWVRDRISTLRVFAPFKENFATLHYHFVERDGSLLILPLSPLARSLGSSFSAVRELVTIKEDLVLCSTLWQNQTVRAVGAHGTSVTIDNERISWEEFSDRLTDRVREEPVLLAAAPPSHRSGELSPLRARVVVANHDGVTARVVEAFVHLGAPDAPLDGQHQPAHQIQYVARVNPLTGKYTNARSIRRGRIEEFARCPDTGEAFRGTVPHWHQLLETLSQMSRFAPQLEFVQYDTLHHESGFQIISLAAHPAYPQHFHFSPDTVAFLRSRRTAKKKKFDTPKVRLRRAVRNAKLRLRRDFARVAYPKGLRPYQATRWPSDVLKDLFQVRGVTLGRKIWAYRHGYLSYRLDQYGITPKTRHRYISDFEYRWLRHINGKYRYWLEDKVSIKYVASRFADHLPEYYFHTIRVDGRTQLIPLMDCPAGFGQDLSEVLQLVRRKQVLALKPDEGSHGAGFYRLEAKGKDFALNGEPATSEEVLAVLSAPDAEYLVTEFINQHPDLAKIYPDSVNTIRIVVYKSDGVNPQVGATYLRMGSRLSGYVDNVAAGGLVAEIDPETGAFSGAFALDSGVLVPHSHHPDTGAAIKGSIPNWKDILAIVIEISYDIEHLEYLGFDVAVTPDGIKIPEINRFPDYPRIAPMSPNLMDYLLGRLNQKKVLHGYDIQRPRSIVSLPRRPQ